MTTFKIDMVHHSYGTSHCEVHIGVHKHRVDFNDGETAELLALGQRVFLRQQADMAREIAEAQPLALAAPNVVEADYTEVPF